MIQQKVFYPGGWLIVQWLKCGFVGGISVLGMYLPAVLCSGAQFLLIFSRRTVNIWLPHFACVARLPLAVIAAAKAANAHNFIKVRKGLSLSSAQLGAIELVQRLPRLGARNWLRKLSSSIEP